VTVGEEQQNEGRRDEGSLVRAAQQSRGDPIDDACNGEAGHERPHDVLEGDVLVQVLSEQEQDGIRGEEERVQRLVHKGPISHLLGSDVRILTAAGL
jgi:hypothetical protein